MPDARDEHTGYQQTALTTILDDPREWSLRQTTFVVLDLETTGGTAADGGITEIGAVKVRAGEILGTLGTLVNPGVPIPPFITALTGITTTMLVEAPPLASVLPSLLEFLRGATVVAHNAPYDVGYLKAACGIHGLTWPAPPVLDTLALARRLLGPDEVPNRKLGTLARFFGTGNQPNHRALDDAKTTVEVLHALLERLGGHGVHTLGEAMEFCRAVSPVRLSKRHFADGLPHAPGVYIFRAADDRALYVGTSGDLATRVKSYFTAAERRRRIDEMLTAAVRVDAVVCAHSLEAEVRELRLIAAHAPPYNRRSKHPQRVLWLKLTAEAYPRLSIVRQRRGDHDTYLGPFGSKRSAELAAAAMHEALPLRQCTSRLSITRASAACALAELGKCPAPCQLAISPDDYETQAAAVVRDAVHGDPEPVVSRLLARIEKLSVGQRFEEAATVRSRLIALLRATTRHQRLVGLARIAELVAARPAVGGGWEISVVRYGRLAAAGVSPPRVHPGPTIDLMVATAETVEPGEGPTPRTPAEESERILRWISQPETRLVRVSHPWSSPVRGAGRYTALLAQADAAARTAVPSTE